MYLTTREADGDDTQVLAIGEEAGVGCVCSHGCECAAGSWEDKFRDYLGRKFVRDMEE